MPTNPFTNPDIISQPNNNMSLVWIIIIVVIAIIIISIIIYLVWRKQQRKEPVMKTDFSQEKVVYVEQTTEHIQTQYTKCAFCGYETPVQFKKCSHCGAVL